MDVEYSIDFTLNKNGSASFDHVNLTDKDDLIIIWDFTTEPVVVKEVIVRTTQ